MWIASVILAGFVLNVLISVSDSANKRASTISNDGNFTQIGGNLQTGTNTTLSNAQNNAEAGKDRRNEALTRFAFWFLLVLLLGRSFAPNASFSNRLKDVRVDDSSTWQKDIDNSESGEKVITRCHLRPVNYWNYTQGRARVVLGHEFGTVVSSRHSSSSTSHGIFSGAMHPYRQNLRLFLLNPFFSHLRGNYIFVKNKSSARLVDCPCNLVFIFAQWCPFSMRAAPYINAIARAFPQLPVVAIDVDEYLQFRWSLGVFYVPKIKIFVGDHVYKEFNGTDTDLDELADFIWLNLRLMPKDALELRKEDFYGPIPTQLLARSSDYRLQVVWVIFLVSSAYFVGYLVDCGEIRRHVTAALQLLSHLLDHRRRRRRNVAAHAALPPALPLPSIAQHASTE